MWFFAAIFEGGRLGTENEKVHDRLRFISISISDRNSTHTEIYTYIYIYIYIYIYMCVKILLQLFNTPKTLYKKKNYFGWGGGGW